MLFSLLFSYYIPLTPGGFPIDEKQRLVLDSKILSLAGLDIKGIYNQLSWVLISFKSYKGITVMLKHGVDLVIKMLSSYISGQLSDKI